MLDDASFDTKILDIGDGLCVATKKEKTK